MWKTTERLVSQSQKIVCTIRNYRKIHTVKPLLSGPPIKRTPSIKWTLSQVLKLTSYISLYNDPLFSKHLY